MRKITLLLTLAAIPVLFGLEPEKSRLQAEYHQSYPMQPGSRLTVNNQNGSIEIAGWDQNTLDISATRYAETQQVLDQLKIDVATAADGVHIRTIVPRLGALLSGSREYRYLQQSIAAFPAPNEFAALMSRSGLDVERVQPLTFGVCCLYVARSRG